MESSRDKKKRDYKEKQRIASLKKEQSIRLRKLGQILNKEADSRTEDEKSFLEENKNFISVVEGKIVKQSQLRLRNEEIEDELSVLNDKIDRLVELTRASDHITVYTGAGISTSSNIPDYRGPKGVWTQLNKNGSILKTQDLALATPSFTHMALRTLTRENIVKHIVSQNCDGLHLRSLDSTDNLSEIHGNMFVEVCSNCRKVHYRDFDVTERTSLRHHSTGRFCVDCVQLDDKEVNCELIDTIVHFGEKGYLEYPLNWRGAVGSVTKSDMIICLGSSLKVLKNYPCLWPKKNDSKKKVSIVIVNLQWTPKDSQTSIKINAKCDLVMEKLMEKLALKVDQYEKSKDRLKNLYIPLRPEEQVTCRRYQLFAENEKPIKSEIDSPTNESSEITPGWFDKGFKRNK